MNKKSKYDYLLTEEENFKNLYLNQRLSSIDIGDIYNIPASAVCYLLNKFGIERRNAKTKSKFTLNHNYFENIDTEEKAYWLGFIYADGYITKNNYVGIALNEKDLEHLIKFKKSINSNHIIHIYNCSDNCYSNKNFKYCRILFKSEQMVKNLNNYGCIEHKSLELKFPQNLDKIFYKDFIRGYFDGDGSFSFSKKNYDFKICGTKEFLLDMFQIFNKSLNINVSEKNIYKRNADNKNNYYSSVGNKLKTKKFLDYIYKDASIYLTRKYEKYFDFLNFIK